MMNRSLAALLPLALLVGCAGHDNDVGTAPGDPDAAVGERAPRPTGTSTGDAPSEQRDRDDRINAPVP